MQNFHNIKYDEETKTAVVGPGQTWYDVYSALDQHGVTVLGGRVPTVGVGGLLLGGGKSIANLCNQPWLIV